MALDKVIDSAWLEAGLKKVCDGIRSKTGGSANLAFPDEMDAQIRAIDTQEDLSPELAEQDSLIEQIMAAMDSVTVTITDTGSGLSDNRCAIVVDGVKYTAATTLKVARGTTVTLEIYHIKAIAGQKTGWGTAEVYVGFYWHEDEIVYVNTPSDGATDFYQYVVNGDVTIDCIANGTIYDGQSARTLISPSEATGGESFTPTDSGGTTYKSKFADNNTDLRAILENVNELAGSGGAESVEVQIINADMNYVYYSSPNAEDGEISALNAQSGNHTITCLKNSIIVVTDNYSTSSSVLSNLTSTTGEVIAPTLGDYNRKIRLVMASQSGTIKIR